MAHGSGTTLAVDLGPYLHAALEPSGGDLDVVGVEAGNRELAGR